MVATEGRASNDVSAAGRRRLDTKLRRRFEGGCSVLSNVTIAAAGFGATSFSEDAGHAALAVHAANLLGFVPNALSFCLLISGQTIAEKEILRPMRFP